MHDSKFRTISMVTKRATGKKSRKWSQVTYDSTLIFVLITLG